jgi:DNA polymerase III epsilon subunit-like protein
MKYLFYDTETSGFLPKKNIELAPESQPWIVQMGMILCDEETDLAKMLYLIKSDGRKIDPGAERVHKISVEQTKNGLLECLGLSIFLNLFYQADMVVCHNTDFDIPMTIMALRRNGFDLEALHLEQKLQICTMKSTTDYCALPNKWPGSFKWPKLEELHQKLFGFGIEGAHNALTDVEHLKKCFFELKAREII